MVGTSIIRKLASVKTTFLTLFNKIGFLAKINVLGIQQASILFRNAWPIFFCFILGYPKLTPCVLQVASKCDDSDGRQMLALDGSDKFRKVDFIR